LFFSWYVKNKHFKKGNNLSGQIIPFLLIMLVILLTAALTTIQIGKVSIDKTCSANMADAGSLAAASVWAASLNNLVLGNQLLYIMYWINYISIKQALVDQEERLDKANEYITQAATYSTQALTTLLVVTAVKVIFNLPSFFSPIPRGICTPWLYYDNIIPELPDWARPYIDLSYLRELYGSIAVKPQLVLAEAALADAIMQIYEYSLWAQYLQVITNQFKQSQWQLYCDLRTSMIGVNDLAIEVGKSYALANRCASEQSVSASFSGVEIGSYELEHTKRNYPEVLNVDFPGLVRSWMDQAFSFVPESIRGFLNGAYKWIADQLTGWIDQLFSQPKIENDYFGIQTSSLFFSILAQLKTLVGYQKVTCDVLFAGTIGGTIGCIIAILACLAPPWLQCIIAVIAAVVAYDIFVAGENALILTLLGLSGVLWKLSDFITILKTQDAKILEAWSVGDQVFSSKNCEDVKIGL